MLFIRTGTLCRAASLAAARSSTSREICSKRHGTPTTMSSTLGSQRSLSLRDRPDRLDFARSRGQVVSQCRPDPEQDTRAPHGRQLSQHPRDGPPLLEIHFAERRPCKMSPHPFASFVRLCPSAPQLRRNAECSPTTPAPHDRRVRSSPKQPPHDSATPSLRDGCLQHGGQTQHDSTSTGLAVARPRGRHTVDPSAFVVK